MSSRKNFFILLVSIILTLGLSISFQSLLAAWTVPSSTAPDGNVSPPINQSNIDQVKLGGLGIGGALTVTSNSFFVGNVGFGTDHPDYKIDVEAGDINTSGNYRKAGLPGTSLTCGTGNTPSGLTISGGIIVGAGSCTAIGSASGDNLGNHIAAQTLNMNGNNISGVGQQLDHIANNIFYINSYDGLQLRINSDGSGSTNFGINNSSNSRVFTILDNGNVGIGTANPGAKLQAQSSDAGVKVYGYSTAITGNNYAVDGDALGSGATLNVGGYFAATGATTNYAIQIPSGYPAAGANNYAIYSGSAAQSYFTGNVGIGVSGPTEKLQVSGNITLGSAGSGNFIYAYKNSASNYAGMTADASGFLHIYTGLASPSARVTIDTNGNVGVGTAAPGYKLDVSGNVRWTGTLQGGSVPWARLTSFPSACSSGQYVSAVGSSLTCSTPTGSGGDITAAYAGTGLSGGGASGDVTISLNTGLISSCTNSTTNKIYWNGSQLTCGTDQTGSGGVTSLSQGTGMSFSSNPITTAGTISLNTGLISSCTNSTTNKIYWNGTQLACGTDQTGGTTPTLVCAKPYTTVQGIGVGITTANAACSSAGTGYKVTGGGCMTNNPLGGVLVQDAPSGAAADDWVCKYYNMNTVYNITAFAICCKIQ